MEEMNFTARYKIWIETKDGKGILGDGKWKLLKAVNEAGSLKHAFEKEGLSYRKTWNNIRKIEEGLGFKLIETNRGGIEKGSASLSPKAIAIMTAFEEFHENLDPIFNEALKQLNAKLNSILSSPL
jgi:molybdate transport system regulatory protein